MKRIRSGLKKKPSGPTLNHWNVPVVLVTGCPGSGKSSVVNEVARAADARGSVFAIGSQSRGYEAEQMKASISKLPYRLTTHAIASFFLVASMNFLGRSIPEWARLKASYPGFPNGVVRAVRSAKLSEVGHRDDRPSRLRKTLVRMLAIESSTRGRQGILVTEQESFWHSLIWCGDWSVLDTVPLPDGVILVSPASSQVIAARRQARSSNHDRAFFHLHGQNAHSFIDAQLQRWSEAAAEFAKRQVQVLLISGTADIKGVEEFIADFAR